jgi:F-type H+-transporting ATPase subunit b
VQVDWVTVAAQIINFLVLVYLLKRFLYGPIIAAMERRQQGIAAALADAQHKAQASEREAERYRQMARELDGQKAQLLSRAREEADKQRQTQLQQLREEIAGLRSKWQAEIERDQDNFSKSVRQLIAEQVCAVCRRVLSELAGGELEAQIIAAFLKRLENLPAAEQMQLRSASQAGGIDIDSAFEMAPPQRALLVRALQQWLGTQPVIRFAVVPDLMCGVALRSAGFKLAWNVDAYLNGVEEALLRHLRSGAQR